MTNLLSIARRYTIRSRMRVSGALTVVFVLLVGVAGVVALRDLDRIDEEFVNGPHARAVQGIELSTLMGNIRRYEKDVMLSFDSPELSADYIKKWLQTLDGTIATIEPFVHGTEDEASAATEVKQRVERYRAQALPVMRKLQEGAYDTSSSANRLIGPAKDDIRLAEKSFLNLIKALESQTEASRASAHAAKTRAFKVLGATVGLAALLAIGMAMVNTRSICQPIDQARAVTERIADGDLAGPVVAEGSDEAAALTRSLARMQSELARIVASMRASTDSITTASQEIATGNQDLSVRTEHTASNLQQTASSMEQLTGTVKQTAESARTANQLASSAQSTAGRGGEVVSQVVSTMQDIHASSKKIADIIGVIDGIAFQTNILALNAAVEAARAGEQGRGFAVVAGEVRSLAQRSAQAAKEIKDLIGASVEKVESGSKLVADAGQTMSEIVASVQRVSDIINEITAAAAEQSEGIGQVNHAVNSLDQMTQQNAALVEQSAAAAASLKDQAAQLAASVSVFKTAAA